MAKIKTRKHVDLAAVDRRLEQVGMTAGLVMRHNVERGEFEIETTDAGIPNAELERIVESVPESPSDGDGEAAAERRARRRERAVELVAAQRWTPVEQEAAIRLLLEAEIERG